MSRAISWGLCLFNKIVQLLKALEVQLFVEFQTKYLMEFIMNQCTYFINGRRRLRATLSLNCGLKIMQFASRSEKLKQEAKFYKQVLGILCALYKTNLCPHKFQLMGQP